MSYKVIAIPKFEKELKRLAKKFVSIKTEYIRLVKTLSANPDEGVSIGNHCFKIRLSIASKGKGKSGGARVITYFYVEGETVYLLSIYDKSDKESITDKELLALLKNIPE